MPIRRRISDPKGFARRVAKLREEKGLTLAELGQEVGVSGTCVWNWESGNTYPKADSLRALATALRTTPTYLTEGRDDNTRTGSELAPETSAATPSPTEKKGLSIAEAKEGLSLFFGVPAESVQITISG